MKLTLHNKTLIAMSATLVGLIGVLYATSSAILVGSLKVAERNRVQETVEGVLGVVDAAEGNFASRFIGWSAWDDTYTFIKDKNKNYIKSNLIPEQLAGLQINMVLFINTSNQIVYGTAFDRETNKLLPIPDGIKKYLTSKSPVLQHSKPESILTGIIMLPKSPMLITSQPILTSKGSGPIRGSLIFGRYIDAQFIKSLSRLARLPLTEHQLNEANLPPDFQAARKTLLASSPIASRPINEEKIAGYTLLKDIYNQPVLILRTEIFRDIYQQGQTSQKHLLIASLMVGLGFCIVSLLLIDKMVLSRLTSLSNEVNKIRESRDPTWRLSVVGNDELSGLTCNINTMLEALENSQKELEQKNSLIRKVFGRYLTEEVVSNLLASPENLQFGGERHTITILTSDLRGFTNFSEKLPPEDVVNIINFYLRHMADVISKYNGTIDEFMGDGILILFGAPTAREDDAVRAVACAVDMQLAMAPINQQMQEWGFPPLEMGIGINTGEVVVGNIGSDIRAKYGVVGSQVNLTYRIESYTVGGEILITESTLKEVRDIVKVIGEKHVQPKGVTKPVTVYKIGGIGGEYNLFLPEEEKEEVLLLPEEIPLTYAVLDGKHIDETGYQGSIVELARKQAKIRLANLENHSVPPAMTNIKINLLTSLGESEDVYAKVLETPADDGSFYIAFTSVPLTIREMFNNIIKNYQLS